MTSSNKLRGGKCLRPIPFPQSDQVSRARLHRTLNVPHLFSAAYVAGRRGLVSLSAVTMVYASTLAFAADQKWEVSRSEDRFTGAQQVTLKTDIGRCSFFEIRCKDEYPSMRFAMDCDERKEMVFDGLVRVDDTKPVFSQFYTLENSSSFYAGLTRQTFIRMLDARRISIRIKIGGSTTQDLDFTPLPDPSAIDAIGVACPVAGLPDDSMPDFSGQLKPPRTPAEFEAEKKTP